MSKPVIVINDINSFQIIFSFSAIILTWEHCSISLLLKNFTNLQLNPILHGVGHNSQPQAKSAPVHQVLHFEEGPLIFNSSFCFGAKNDL